MADDSLTIHIDGKPYELDDFELGELEWLEDELGTLDDAENVSTVKAAVRFVYIIKHREDPNFTLDDARKLKMSVFEEAPVENGDRPTKPAGKSKPAKSGATSSTKA